MLNVQLSIKNYTLNIPWKYETPFTDVESATWEKAHLGAPGSGG